MQALGAHSPLDAPHPPVNIQVEPNRLTDLKELKKSTRSLEKESDKGNRGEIGRDRMQVD